ncbi:hypothetical protein J2Z60_001837 [Lactobacillus colini]|uniref:Prenylated flavin chaperone LpdD-like domain-containing protein n=1 Tax=Lactobacillus colini TaxID=1819254 RepID=A0ABS4MG25_9LACO|nr:hypothetical protein [Lactobacillus colini]MBP2058649.1 hypothetical protein [Lactobacillus colini]
MIEKTFTVSQEGYTISAACQLINQDLLVNLFGGDVPHIGGIVSWDSKTKEQGEIRFASHSGRIHKDIFLAEKFAQKIEKHLPGNLCVTAGVHVDGITQMQIEASFPMTEELSELVLAWVRENSQNIKQPKYTTHIKNYELTKKLMSN